MINQVYREAAMSRNQKDGLGERLVGMRTCEGKGLIWKGRYDPPAENRSELRVISAGVAAG